MASVSTLGAAGSFAVDAGGALSTRGAAQKLSQLLSHNSRRSLDQTQDRQPIVLLPRQAPNAAAQLGLLETDYARAARHGRLNPLQQLVTVRFGLYAPNNPPYCDRLSCLLALLSPGDDVTTYFPWLPITPVDVGQWPPHVHFCAFCASDRCQCCALGRSSGALGAASCPVPAPRRCSAGGPAAAAPRQRPQPGQPGAGQAGRRARPQQGMRLGRALPYTPLGAPCSGAQDALLMSQVAFVPPVLSTW